MGAERTITVRLRAVNDAYRKAIAEAASDTTKFASTAQSGFKQVGGSVYDLGQSMERRLSLPLAALGVAAVKAANDFEMSFAKMQGLANVPASEIDGLKQSVMGLSRDTAQAPAKLAEALYYVRSSGVSAAGAADVLEVSAKAATAGLGEAADIAKAVTFAMNAYGEGNLTAAHAADVLSAAVREGTLEASDLAPVMGQIIPMASSLGISFDTVAGTMAVMSRNGTSSYQAVTGLTAVLSTLLSTSKEGEGVLAAHGLSLAQLREVAAGPQGLVGVFRLLDETFQHNDETLAQVVPNIRALRTFLNVLSQDGAKVDEVMKNVTNSTGSLNTAFEAVKGTDAFKMQQDLNEAKIALVQLGAALAPIATMILGTFGSAVSLFGEMPPEMQQMTAAALALLVVVGPLVKGFGMLITNLGLIKSGVAPVIRAIQTLQLQLALAEAEGIALGTALKGLAADAALTAGAFAILLAPIIGVVGGIASVIHMNEQHARSAREAKARMEAWRDELLKGGDTAEVAAEHFKTLFASGKDKALESAIANVGLKVTDLSNAITAGGPALAQFLAILKGGGELSFDVAKQIGQQIQAYQAGIEASRKALAAQGQRGEITVFTPGSTAEIAAVEAALKGAGGGMDSAAASAEDLAKALKDALASFDALVAQAFGVADAQSNVDDAFAAFNETAKKSGGAVRDLVQEERDAIRASEAVADARRDLAKAEDELAKARQGPTEREQIDAAIGLAEATLGVADAQHALKQAQKNLTEERKKGKNGDVVGAQLALQHAQLNLRKSTLSVSDAQKNQNDVMAEGQDSTKRVTDAIDGVEQATRRLRDAQWAQEAQQDSLNKSTAASANAEDDRKRKIDAAVDAVTALIRKQIEMGQPGGQVMQSIDAQILKLKELERAHGDVNDKIAHGIALLIAEKFIVSGTKIDPNTPWLSADGAQDFNPFGGSAGNRALGGPVDAGRMYRVNEGGPEWFVPSMPGTMVPASGYTASGASAGFVAPLVIEMDGVAVKRLVVAGSHRDGGWDVKVRNR